MPDDFIKQVVESHNARRRAVKNMKFFKEK
uniref:SCP domain-containing protein n=1 Tax=Heterorhabditis bacteriophora TaxID=37862 RepID=A0A1I7WXT4_HETBA